MEYHLIDSHDTNVIEIVISRNRSQSQMSNYINGKTTRNSNHNTKHGGIYMIFEHKIDNSKNNI